MSKILVTGGAGFIGSHIVDKYIDLGHEVFVIDDLSNGKKENLNPKARFYKIDIRDKKIGEIFAKEKPEIINHHAAQIDLRKSIKDPVLDAKINILGILNLLENAIKHKVKKFIFASSGGAIYGDTKNIPTCEDEKPKPLSPYAIAKLVSEQYLEFYFKVHNLPYVALRYANVYGPRQDPLGEAGVAIFMSKLLTKKPPTINGDGNQTRDYIYVEDVAQANILALKDNITGLFNIGTQKETSVNELFRLISRLLNIEITAERGSSIKGEVKRSCLDSSKAKNILKWSPEVNLENGLKETLKWQRLNIAYR